MPEHKISDTPDAIGGQDSTVGLNRDLDKAYEITRDEESRTDLYVTDTSLHDAMNPKETLQKWEDGVLDYHKTALRNLDQAAVGVAATINRVERLLGRDMAAGALQVTTRDFAEDTLEQLIIGGKSRSEAMAMMESETFQNDVLRELNRLWTLDEKTLSESKALVDQLVQQQKQHQEPGMVLESTFVESERLTLLQDNLRSLASIKKFIEGNQDKAQAIGVLLALTQGPKGVIQAVAISAAEQTPLGQRLMERLEALENYAGQSIAEYMEGKGLSAGVEEENYLLGGGKLAVSILGTGISSIGGGKGSSISDQDKKGDAHKPDTAGGVRETGSVSAGPKVPPKLQPLSNPPQGPVIPSGWVSRPGKTPGSTIYYPPGSDPSASGSTYIRLMPSGSTPVPGLENGYWISVKNGQPINPATGGTGTRGDTHVPLPPNTMPPKR